MNVILNCYYVEGGGWIILGWILERWDRVMWTGLVWLRIRNSSCEFGIEPSGSMECWETM
jgi:hypothetical protein